MASRQHARQRPAGFQESIAYPVLWPLRYAVIWALLLLILALIAISLDLVFAKRVWAEGTALAQMEAMVRHAVSISPNPALTDDFAEGAYRVFFGFTGIHERIVALGDAYAGAAFSGTNTLLALREEIAVAMMGARLFGARLATVANALPLLCLAYAAFMIDGLAERMIRKACGGRESATIYHLAKHSHFAVLPMLLAFYLCMPVHVDSLWIVLPAILVSGLLLRLQTKYYKKYM